MAALSPHQRLHSFNAFHLERLGDSSDHRVLGNHLFVFLSGGWRQEWTRGLTDRGLRHPATVLPAVFVSLSRPTSQALVASVLLPATVFMNQQFSIL